MSALVKAISTVLALLGLMVMAPRAAHATEAPQSERLSVYTHPFPVLMMVWPSRDFYVPLGLSIPINSGWEFAAESLVFSRRDPFDYTPSRRIDGVLTSAGLTRRAGSGPSWSRYLTMKAIVGGLANPGVGSAFFSRRRAGLVHLGADVGVEFRVRRLLLGAGIGASAGYCSGCSEGFVGPLLPVQNPVRSATSGSFTWMLNLNLLRVGFTL